MDVQLENAIISGDLILIKKIVYSGDIQIRKKHFTICHTMKRLCIINNNDSIFDDIESFLKKEYKPKSSHLQYSLWIRLCIRLFGIHKIRYD